MGAIITRSLSESSRVAVSGWLSDLIRYETPLDLTTSASPAPAKWTRENLRGRRHKVADQYLKSGSD